mmetsp:Transcript_21265/g.46166  ORF Transcript_21265/g.46166 Transcript_21265/m.46166 type:complete len:518 (+) Transcript_21265:73-1626(+)
MMKSSSKSFILFFFLGALIWGKGAAQCPDFGFVEAFVCADYDNSPDPFDPFIRIIYEGYFVSFDDWGAAMTATNAGGAELTSNHNNPGTLISGGVEVSILPAGDHLVRETTVFDDCSVVGACVDEVCLETFLGPDDGLTDGDVTSPLALLGGIGSALGVIEDTGGGNLRLITPDTAQCQNPTAANPCVVSGDYLTDLRIDDITEDFGVFVGWDFDGVDYLNELYIDAPFMDLGQTCVDDFPISCSFLPFFPYLFNFGGANGDPHFLRWGHNHHDSFHGECDLVLLSSQKAGIHAQIRTKIRKHYSYIWKMAIGIGSHTLEIDKEQWTVDGSRIDLSGNTTNSMSVNATNSNIAVAAVGEEEYKIQWGTDSSIVISITGIFLNVKFQVGSDDFSDSVGMMGKFGSGDMLDRKGSLMDSEDMVAYGMEWQVKHDRGDPKLFSKLEGPQWPEQQCVMPQWTDPKKKTKKKKRRGRRLRDALENEKLQADAKKACGGAVDYDLCLEDVLLTGELKLAKSFF